MTAAKSQQRHDDDSAGLQSEDWPQWQDVAARMDAHSMNCISGLPVFRVSFLHDNLPYALGFSYDYLSVTEAPPQRFPWVSSLLIIHRQPIVSPSVGLGYPLDNSTTTQR